MTNSTPLSTEAGAATRKNPVSRDGVAKATVRPDSSQHQPGQPRVSHVTRRMGEKIARDRHGALRELANR